MGEREFVSIEDVAETYGLQRRQILRLVERGKFPPALRIGGRSSRLIRFRARDVAEWEAGAWQLAGDEAARAAAITEAIRQPAAVRRRRGRSGASSPASGSAPGARPTAARRSHGDR